ncbi:MAG: MauE/DoxX family redox-associated membrane protein [Rickettsiales bacterium]
MAKKPEYKKRVENRGGELSDYWPLFSLIFITASAGYAVTWHLQASMSDWMHYFMGFFLCSFAMLKIFNLSAFADGFEMYDIIAKRKRAYGYVYPFIELGLGLGYLSFIVPQAIYITTIIVMTLGAVGVITALRKKLDINCPCMGSVLDVPLSTVTLTEDIGMGVMVLIMLTNT